MSSGKNALICGISGFPASDVQVYSFLNAYAIDRDLLEARIYVFMFALFKKCDDVIKNAQADPQWDRAQGAAWFREKMTKGQTLVSQGPYRVEFYNDVVKNAQRVSGDLL